MKGRAAPWLPHPDRADRCADNNAAASALQTSARQRNKVIEEYLDRVAAVEANLGSKATVSPVFVVKLEFGK
jgi:hypothetical protein